MVASLARVIGDLDRLTWLRATVFAERGRHARATIGATALAFGVPTIVEGTVSCT